MGARHTLTIKEIREALAKQKATGAPTVLKQSDGAGLTLVSRLGRTPTWVVRRRRKEVTIGRWPAMGLEAARKAAQALPEPEPVRSTGPTFGDASARFWRDRQASWSATHRRDVRRLIDELDKKLAEIPLHALLRDDLAAAIAPAVERGALDVARDLRTYAGAVLRWWNGHCAPDERAVDVSVDVRLPERRPVRHHPAVPIDEIPSVLRAIGFSNARFVTRAALRLLLLTGMRSGELRMSTWTDVNLAESVWNIPNARMKWRRRIADDFSTPLSRQALELLRELHERRVDDWVFPGGKPGKPLSEAAMLTALKTAGMRGRQSPHGFRALLTSWAASRGYSDEVVEAHLAHLPPGQVRKAYQRYRFWPQRIELAQAWADYLDGFATSLEGFGGGLTGANPEKS